MTHISEITLLIAVIALALWPVVLLPCVSCASVRNGWNTLKE